MASVQDSTDLSPSPYWPQSQPLLASPPAPLRMERGVICEVTPIGLLKEGEGMPDGRRESYEAVPRRPEQQGTEGPALSMSPVCSVPLLPCLLLQPTCSPVYSSTCQLATLPCLSHTLLLSQTYLVPISALCYSSNLFICYPVSYYKQLVHPSTRPPVNLPRYPVSTIPCPCLRPLLLPELVHLLPCLSYTLSYLRPLLLPELVHLLPCLSHTLSPYPPYPVPTLSQKK